MNPGLLALCRAFAYLDKVKRSTVTYELEPYTPFEYDGLKLYSIVVEHLCTEDLVNVYTKWVDENGDPFSCPLDEFETDVQKGIWETLG